MDKQPIASSSPEVIVVEASAGSGKTYRLAKRYLSLLINSPFNAEQISLRSILAITFTNKATVEMKERILELLKRIAFDNFPDKEFERDLFMSLGVDKAVARQKAFRIMDELIRHYSFFQVQTIDSFINSLLLGCALRIGRSSRFMIKRDYRRFLSYCLDLVIEQAAGDKALYRLLEEFLQHYLFVENRKGWFPKEDILELMESLFQIANKYGKLFRESGVQSREIIKKKIGLFEKIKDLAGAAPEGINKQALIGLTNFIGKTKEIFETKDLPASLQEREVPMNKNNRCLAVYAQRWKKVQAQIGDLVELEATAFYNPYIQLFARLLDSFQEFARKEDVLFLEELNRACRSLFGSPDSDRNDGMTVAELYYRLATRFRHYLIDEFQDTSVLQWRNLELMVEEALSTGGSLFYVGDKKQAIYRFRGGESHLFDAVRRDFSRFQAREERLKKNYRSQKTIVEFNNRVFSGDNLRTLLQLSGIAAELSGDARAQDEIAEVFKDAVQEHRREPDKGYVSIERFSESGQSECNTLAKEKLIFLISDLKARGFRYEDIAVLTRDNEEVELVTSWLLSSGIPVESEKTLNILQNNLVRELLSFLYFLQSPIDDLSFAAFLLGKIFSAVSGISQGTIRDFIFTRQRNKSDIPSSSLYHGFREAYPEVWVGYLDEFFKSVGFVSPYELCIGLYRKFGLMEKFPGNQAFFMKLLEVIKGKEDEYVDLGGFLAYLKTAPDEELYVAVPQSNSVKILTIHKAKGLEFPAVIIPFLRMDITPETAGRGSSSYVVEAGEQKLALLRIPKYSLPYSERLKIIYADAYKKACIDELNALYVALTRAQQELHIFIPAKSGIGKNKARFLVPEDILTCGVKLNYAPKDKTAQTFLDIPVSIYRDWIELLKDEFGDARAILNRGWILQGNVLHVLLSGMGACTKKNLKELIDRAMRNAGKQFPFIADIAVYEQKLNRILHAEVVKDIFFAPSTEVFCEREIVNRFGDTKRIDRLIVREKEVWVVDYKSSRDNHAAHRQQAQEYMSIIGQLYREKKVRGFLLYLDELNLEEVFNET